MVHDHVLCAVDVLGGVGRIGQRHTLAPAVDRARRRPFALDVHEQDVAFGLDAEARAERRDERHRDPSQLDAGQADR